MPGSFAVNHKCLPMAAEVVISPGSDRILGS